MISKGRLYFVQFVGLNLKYNFLSVLPHDPLKRQRIADIPLHRAYCQGDEGPLKFAGLRQIDGETLALLKRQEQIIVLPIDAPTSRRMQKLAIGDTVRLDAKGKVLVRGHSR